MTSPTSKRAGRGGKISDQERLDWMEQKKDDVRISRPTIDCRWWDVETIGRDEYFEGMTLRQALDAAIRASRGGKRNGK